MKATRLRPISHRSGLPKQRSSVNHRSGAMAPEALDIHATASHYHETSHPERTWGDEEEKSSSNLAVIGFFVFLPILGGLAYLALGR